MALWEPLSLAYDEKNRNESCVSHLASITHICVTLFSPFFLVFSEKNEGETRDESRAPYLLIITQTCSQFSVANDPFGAAITLILEENLEIQPK